MNDEIKELLSRLKRCNEEQYLVEIDCRCSKLLLDCITDLKKENEDYKSRCEKANEYIKENKDKYYHDWGEDDGGYDTYLDETEIDKLSNILNGGE